MNERQRLTVETARRKEYRPLFGMGRGIEDLSEFPGWDRFKPFAANYLTDNSWVVDIGGGAWPSADPDEARNIRTVLVDIDGDEISYAEGRYTVAVETDATAGSAEIQAAMQGEGADIVLSHMLIEHVKEPDKLHRTIYDILKPGGLAVHAYPIPNNLPLAANALLPESVSRLLVRLAQPHREIEKSEGKFPAYYRRCHLPSARARRYFEGLGFEVEVHTAFAGHGYFRRVPVAALLERISRRISVRLQIPFVTFGLIVLRKADDAVFGEGRT